MATVRTLLAVYLGLMLLLAATFGSHFLSWGHWNVVINLSISTAKAGLIVFFFMNLRHEKVLVRCFAAASLVWLLILFMLALGDYLNRGPSGIG